MLGYFNDIDESAVSDKIKMIESASSAELDKELRRIYPDLVGYNWVESIL